MVSLVNKTNVGVTQSAGKGLRASLCDSIKAKLKPES